MDGINRQEAGERVGLLVGGGGLGGWAGNDVVIVTPGSGTGTSLFIKEREFPCC